MEALPLITLVIAPLLPFEATRVARGGGARLHMTQRVGFAFLGIPAGLAGGGPGGHAVLFGPSNLTGDDLGLPWFTMLPALGLGFRIAAKDSRAAEQALPRRVARPQAPTG